MADTITAGATNAAAANWATFDTAVAGLAQVTGGIYDDYTAICRWDEVPNRTVTGSWVIGIAAFHASGTGVGGITSVTFYLNGGSGLTVTTLEAHPRSGEMDFCAAVNTAVLDDAKSEVRAIIRSEKGYARVLSGALATSGAPRQEGEHSLILNCNNGGTLPARQIYCNVNTGNDTTGTGLVGAPYATTYKCSAVLMADGDRDGATIHVTGGSCVWPNQMNTYEATDQFCTLSLEGDAVLDGLTSLNYNGLGTKFQRVTGGSIVGVNIGQATDPTGFAGAFLWLDNVDLDGVTEEGAAGADITGWTLGMAITDFAAVNLDTALAYYTYISNGEISYVGEDVLVGNQGLIQDLDIHDTRQIPPGHGDLVQYNIGFDGAPNGVKNTILRSIRSRRVGIGGEGVQGFFLRSNGDITSHYDIAIVNCDFAFAGNSQILHDVEHLVIWHSQFLPNAVTDTGGSLIIADDAPGGWPTTTINGISVRNCVFDNLTATWSGGQDTALDEWADDCHFITTGDYGTNSTLGSTLAALFTDPDNEGYTPKTGGALVARTAAALIPTDLTGASRLATGAIGAYELGSSPGTIKWHFWSAGGLLFQLKETVA